MHNGSEEQQKTAALLVTDQHDRKSKSKLSTSSSGIRGPAIFDYTHWMMHSGTIESKARTQAPVERLPTNSFIATACSMLVCSGDNGVGNNDYVVIPYARYVWELCSTTSDSLISTERVHSESNAALAYFNFLHYFFVFFFFCYFFFFFFHFNKEKIKQGIRRKKKPLINKLNTNDRVYLCECGGHVCCYVQRARTHSICVFTRTRTEIYIYACIRVYIVQNGLIQELFQLAAPRAITSALPLYFFSSLLFSIVVVCMCNSLCIFWMDESISFMAVRECEWISSVYEK